MILSTNSPSTTDDELCSIDYSQNTSPIEPSSNADQIECSSNITATTNQPSLSVDLNNRNVSKRRSQVKNACVNCQKACKKCDEGRPCQRCVKLGIANTCVDSPRKERKKGFKRGPYRKKIGAPQHIIPKKELYVYNNLTPTTTLAHVPISQTSSENAEYKGLVNTKITTPNSDLSSNNSVANISSWPGTTSSLSNSRIKKHKNSSIGSAKNSTTSIIREQPLVVKSHIHQPQPQGSTHVPNYDVNFTTQMFTGNNIVPTDQQYSNLSTNNFSQQHNNIPTLSSQHCHPEELVVSGKPSNQQQCVNVYKNEGTNINSPFTPIDYSFRLNNQFNNDSDMLLNSNQNKWSYINSYSINQAVDIDDYALSYSNNIEQTQYNNVPIYSTTTNNLNEGQSVRSKGSFEHRRYESYPSDRYYEQLSYYCGEINQDQQLTHPSNTDNSHLALIDRQQQHQQLQSLTTSNHSFTGCQQWPSNNSSHTTRNNAEVDCNYYETSSHTRHNSL